MGPAFPAVALNIGIAKFVKKPRLCDWCNVMLYQFQSAIGISAIYGPFYRLFAS